MIFQRKKINFKFSESRFWTPDVKSTEIIVRDRKYRLDRDPNGITIERKINDIFDLMGFVPFKRLGIAKGKIEKNENQTTVNLEIGIKLIYENLLVATTLIFGLICIWILFNDFGLGIIFTGFLGFNLGIVYLIFNHGVNGFKSELEDDINYFERRVEK